MTKAECCSVAVKEEGGGGAWTNSDLGVTNLVLLVEIVIPLQNFR